MSVSTPTRTRRWLAAVPRAAARPSVPPPTLSVADTVHAADLPAWQNTAPATVHERPAAAPQTATPPARTPKTPKARRAKPPPLQPGDQRFLDSVRAAQQTEAQPAANAAITLMLVGIVVAFLWAANTRVEQITRTEGRVVPDGREQVIASLEGGILRELMVREGAQVTAGQPLLRLDPTRFEAQQNEGQAKRQSLKATIARLNAEASGKALAFPPELGAAQIANEREAWQARRRLLDETVGANASSIALVQRELDMAEGLSRKGLMSDVEVMRLRRQIIDLRQQSLERQNRFRQEASTELLKAQSELAQLEEQMVAREDAVRRTVLNSPVDGLVKNIRVNTLGGVVSAGAPIMEIVPLGARRRVEARIKPADIGFIRVGQVAEVKLSAYDYNLYGGLRGTVEAISPDALGDPERAGAGGGADSTWFRAAIAIDQSTLTAQGQPLPVLPGMTGTVEINTGERSVLDFVLRPLLKAREAFRER